MATAPMTNSGAVNVTELMWAYAPPTSNTGIPGYAYQTSGGTVFADENGNVNTVSDQALAVSNAVTVWQQQDGLYTVNLLDKDGTLQMIQELSSAGTGSWAPPLPLVPDLGAVFGVPTDPSEATLFAVGLDENLRVLSLGPSGWVQTLVNQVGVEHDDFAAYRVQAIVTDANGTPVAGAQVAIGTQDLPVGCWTPAGAFYVTPDTPAVVTADVKGEITFSVPAEELDCATLVVQAHDFDGNPTGSAFTVTPDTDVRGFLGGTGTLTDQGSLTYTSLLGATSTGSTTKLFTGLTSLPPGQQQQDAATASVQALGQLVKAGNDAQNGTVTATAFTLNLSSGGPTYSPTPPSASSARLEGEALGLSWGSFDHLFDSIGHALRHGAMELKNAVIKLAEDGKSWLVDLVVQIGDDIWSAADLAITDMKHAFHVIGGFFNALGADIKSAVQWLWHDIVAFLKDVKTTADQLQTWITDLGGEVTTALTTIKIDTDNWFTAKESQATDAITYMKNHAEGTLGGPPLPPPTNDTGSSGSQSKLLKDLGEIAKVMNDAPGKWLLDKFLSYLPVTDTGPVIDQSTYEPLLQQLAKDWVDGMTFSQNLFTFIETTLSDGFSSGGAADKSGLTNTQLTTWFTDLNDTVVNGLTLLDDIADTALDIAITGIALAEDYFTYPYNIVGDMGLIGLHPRGGRGRLRVQPGRDRLLGGRLPRCARRGVPRLQLPLPGNGAGHHAGPAARRPRENPRCPRSPPVGRTDRRRAGRPAGGPRERSRRLAGRAGDRRRRGPGGLGNGRPGRRRAAAGRPGDGQARHAVGGHRLLRHPLPAGRDDRAVAERAELGRLGVLSLPRRARHQHDRLGTAAVRDLDGRHPLDLRGRGQGRLDRGPEQLGVPQRRPGHRQGLHGPVRPDDRRHRQHGPGLGLQRKERRRGGGHHRHRARQPVVRRRPARHQDHERNHR